MSSKSNQLLSQINDIKSQIGSLLQKQYELEDKLLEIRTYELLDSNNDQLLNVESILTNLSDAFTKCSNTNTNTNTIYRLYSDGSVEKDRFNGDPIRLYTSFMDMSDIDMKELNKRFLKFYITYNEDGTHSKLYYTELETKSQVTECIRILYQYKKSILT